MRGRNRKYLLIGLLFFVLLTRVPLFDKYAAYMYGDEIRYKRLVNTLNDAKKTDNLLLYVRGIFAIHARPGYAIFYSLPIAMESARPLVAYGEYFNVLVNIAMVWLIYLLVNKLVDQKAAILATIANVCTLSSVIYMRHMLPYDAGVLLILLSFYWYAKYRSPISFGFVMGLSFLVYPSYAYYLIPIPLVALYFLPAKFSGSVEKKLSEMLSSVRVVYKKHPFLYSLFLFVLGFVIPLVILQLVSVNTPDSGHYFQTLQKLTEEVNQGDYVPAWVFLKKYIDVYDGHWGLGMVSLLFLVLFLKNRKKFLPVLVYIGFVFLLLESFSDIIPRTVLYGRTVRPLYMFLLTTSSVVFYYFVRQIGRKYRTALYSLFAILAVVNWWPRFVEYKGQVYPPEFRERSEQYLQDKVGDRYMYTEIYPKKISVDDNNPEPAEKGNYYLVNLTFLYPYFGQLDVPCDEDVIAQYNPHVIEFRPYQYEGYTQQMRDYIATDPPNYRLIYCR